MAKKSFSAGVTKTGVLDNAGGAKIKEIQAKAQYNFQYIAKEKIQSNPKNEKYTQDGIESLMESILVNGLRHNLSVLYDADQDKYGLRQAFDNIKNDPYMLERHAKIGNAVRAAVKEAGLELYQETGFSNTVTVFNVPEGTTDTAILTAMKEKCNIMLAGSFGAFAGKVIRIGHMGENAYPEKVGAVMAGLDLVFKDLGITLKCSLKEAYDRKMSEQ